MSDKKPTNEANKSNRSNNKKKSKGRRVSIFRVMILSIILIAFIGAGVTTGVVLSIIRDTPSIDASNIYEMLDETSFILDANGQVLEKVQSENYRTIVEYNQMPKDLINAFVAIEDERFWTHSGVDVRRIFGAAFTNFRTGSRQGASTINQQLAINLFLSRSDSSYTRKIRDAYYGIQLDKHLSKEQILETYLNTIYLGSGSNGVQAASQVYFSKDVDELTIAESALIAGITRNPTRYSPIRTLTKEQVDEERHYVLNDSDELYTIVFNEDESVVQRQRLVLSVMRRLEYITETEYQEALNEDLKESLNPARLTNDEVSSYFGDLVKKDAIDTLQATGLSADEARQLLYSGGLRIYSTLDLNIQRILEEEYLRHENFPGTIYDENESIQPQSAMVIMDHQTGQIKALVGGREVAGQKVFNRALSPRQPGSAIKPIAVYAPAINSGQVTAGTVVDDIPVYYNKSTPDTPSPRNYNQTYQGLISVRQAVRDSSNVGAVLVADMLGPDDNSSFMQMFEAMESMGITSVVTRDNPVIVNGGRYTDETFSTALGGMTRGVSPLEMTAAYATFANQGVYVEPITITEIRDSQGNVIVEKNQRKNRVMSEQAAFVMTDMLKDVVSAGTGTRARLTSSIPVAGKTGTTSNNYDAWFVGYTPYYVGATWIGNDQNRRLEQGSGMSASLWQRVMARVHEDLSPKDFTTPDGLIRLNICGVSGKLATEYCQMDPRGSMIRSELFIRGTEPTEYSTAHVKADIHTPTGKLSTDLTPPWEIESRIFVQREVPYYPEEHGGIVPRDYQYELPRDYYDPIEDGDDGPFYDGSPDGSIDNGTDDSEPNNGNQEQGQGNQGQGNLGDDLTIIDSNNNGN